MDKTIDIYTLDEGVKGSGMVLFLFVGHWMKIGPQNSKIGQVNVFTLYGCAAEAIFCCPTENSRHLEA